MVRGHESIFKNQELPTRSAACRVIVPCHLDEADRNTTERLQILREGLLLLSQVEIDLSITVIADGKNRVLLEYLLMLEEEGLVSCDIIFQKQSGKVSSVLRAARSCPEEFVLIMDSDTWVIPAAVERAVQLMALNSVIGILGLFPSLSPMPGRWRTFRWALLRNRLTFRQVYDEIRFDRFFESINRSPIWHNFCSQPASRQLLPEVQLSNERLLLGSCEFGFIVRTRILDSGALPNAKYFLGGRDVQRVIMEPAEKAGLLCLSLPLPGAVHIGDHLTAPDREIFEQYTALWRKSLASERAEVPSIKGSRLESETGPASTRPFVGSQSTTLSKSAKLFQVLFRLTQRRYRNTNLTCRNGVFQ